MKMLKRKVRYTDFVLTPKVHLKPENLTPFRPEPLKASKEPTVGWVEFGTMDQGPSDLNYGPDQLISVRLDRKKVDRNHLKIEVEKAIKEAKETRGIQRLSRSARRGIGEGIEESLLRNATSTVQVVDVAFIDGGRVARVFTQSKAQLEHISFFMRKELGGEIAIRDLVKETFGEDFSLEEEVGEYVLNYLGENQALEVSGKKVECWFSNKMGIINPYGDKIKAENEVDTPHLHDDDKLVEATVEWFLEEMDPIGVTINAECGFLLKSVKTPMTLGLKDEAAVIEQMYLLETVEKFVVAALKAAVKDGGNHEIDSV